MKVASLRGLPLKNYCPNKSNYDNDDDDKKKKKKKKIYCPSRNLQGKLSTTN